MNQLTQHKWFYGISAAFIVVQSIAVWAEWLWMPALPVVFLFGLLVFFKLDLVLLLLCFLVPLSINFDNIGFGLGISLPAEPLLMLILPLALFKFLIDGQYDRSIFKHPITIVIVLQLVWTFITTLTSEVPLASVKFLVSKLWFVVAFYFLGIPLFKKFTNIHLYIGLYTLALLLVIGYVLKEHSAYHFSQKYSYTITMPFYVSHGVYAAAIAFVLPILCCYILLPAVFKYSTPLYIAIAATLGIYCIALFFSYTRAAWLSIILAVAAMVPILLKIRFNTILVLVFTLAGLVFTFQNELLYVLSKNNQDSSKDYFEHFRSASNIKTDASNMERLNRWSCAIDMFVERPIVGYGPGTYSFVYGPFQLSRNRTIISTDYGDGGNAHSEYLQPLCETGLIGAILMLLLVYTGLSTAFRLYYTAQDPKVKYTSLGILLGMLTYFVHGIMNNYSETDKIAILFWGFFAMITAIDLYHQNQVQNESNSN